MNILRTAIQSGTVEVAAMCDVDTNQLNGAYDEVVQIVSDKPKKFGDYRELIARGKARNRHSSHTRSLASTYYHCCRRSRRTRLRRKTYWTYNS